MAWVVPNVPRCSDGAKIVARFYVIESLAVKTRP
jgi:hypothetical protein